MNSVDFTFGNRRLAGQPQAREQITRTYRSGRLSHAYLLSGPTGSGKAAFALAFAELLNGVDNLTDLGAERVSEKSSWFTHPDIHFFIPLPSSIAGKGEARSRELQERLTLLKNDPYEIVDFRHRPVIDEENSSKNLQAFYPVDYFSEVIRKRCYFTPNEGRYTIVILTEIDTMRKETANAFLKLLEEPPANLIFILTTGSPDRLLPTILSRCQQIRLHPLGEETIARALVRHDGHEEDQARYLARISDGNYALTRTLDPGQIRQTRQELVTLLRGSYAEDATVLLKLIQQWHASLNTESQIALCNTLELLLRDLMIFRETGREDLITNIDQIDVIRKFCESLQLARLDTMIDELQEMKQAIGQNVQFKLAFTTLVFRFSRLMRGRDPVIPPEEPWHHLPARNAENSQTGLI